MKLEEVARLTARAVSVYLFIQAIFLLIEVPSALISLLHETYSVSTGAAWSHPTERSMYWVVFYSYNLFRVISLSAICLFFAFQFKNRTWRVMAYLLGESAASSTIE